MPDEPHERVRSSGRRLTHLLVGQAAKQLAAYPRMRGSISEQEEPDSVHEHLPAIVTGQREPCTRVWPTGLMRSSE